MNTKVFAGLLIVLGILVAAQQGVFQKAILWLQGTDLGTQLHSFQAAEESLPAPLRGLIDPSVNSHLTVQGVIDETNLQRDNNGQSPLHMNTKLNAAAESKIDDMFKNQYFEHESPDGKSPADIISAQGYEYIVVGENLALGNFKDDKTLVEAWMNSPGHRANILNGKYHEIGVAVRRGEFEGKQVWLAVQEFGSPLSSCPSPSENLKGQIDANRTAIADMQSDLQQQKSQLDSSRYSSQEQYNQAVARYNALAGKINKLSEETKKLVSQYNEQVNAFNSCLETNT